MDASLFYKCALAVGDKGVQSRGKSVANTLEKIFAMLWTRLMGLKSVTLVASVFLGRRMMQAEFSHSKPRHSM